MMLKSEGRFALWFGFDSLKTPGRNLVKILLLWLGALAPRISANVTRKPQRHGLADVTFSRHPGTQRKHVTMGMLHPQVHEERGAGWK